MGKRAYTAAHPLDSLFVALYFPIKFPAATPSARAGGGLTRFRRAWARKKNGCGTGSDFYDKQHRGPIQLLTLTLVEPRTKQSDWALIGLRDAHDKTKAEEDKTLACTLATNTAKLL